MNDKFKIALVIFFVFSILIAPVVYTYGTVTTLKIDVVKTERVSKDGDSRYLVFTKDETFENTDSFLHMKFNSSDLHGALEVGNSYTVKVYGWRIPLFSSYRNIVSIEN